MQIQVHADHSIEGRETFLTYISEAVASALGRLSDRITRVEIHVTDQNGAKGGADDKRCVMEARLEGHQPVAVTHAAPHVGQAVDGAVTKLIKRIDHVLGRLRAP